MILPVTLAVATAFSYSFSGIIIKGFSARFGALLASLAVALGVFAVVGAVVLVIGYSGISLYSIVWSVLSGIPLFLGYMLFYRVLERQQASNTFATLEVQVMLLALYGVFFLGEKINIAGIIGIIAITAGILLVSVEKGMKINGKLVPAIVANIFWALSWIMLVYPINHTRNYLLPTLISFITFIALLSAALLISRPSSSKRRQIRPKAFSVGLLAGVSSGVGNSLYSTLIVIKQLVLSAVLSNSSPAIIAAIAHFVYHDKLTRVQVLGIAAVVAGGIILGAL